MVTETRILLAPLTPVHFGNGRPNVAGETDFRGGLFPPTPRTVQGVIRTALLRTVNGLRLGPGADLERIASLVGEPDRLPDGWQIAGPWPAQWREPEDGTGQEVSVWLPCPGHVLFTSPDLHKRDWRFATLLQTPGRTDLGERTLIFHSTARSQSSWLPPDQALRVLRGDLPQNSPFEPLPPFVHPEPHTGVRLEPLHRTAEDAMLYTLGFHRFDEGSGLYVTFSGMTERPLRSSGLTTGVASLGGKNRLARMLEAGELSEASKKLFASDHLPAKTPAGSRFIVWATTPLRAADPMNPGFHRLVRGGAHLVVLTAAVGPPIHLGGFSLARASSAPSHRYLPGGSCWLVEIQGGTDEQRSALLRGIHDACVLGDDQAERAFGFGHCLVALPPPQWSRS